MTSPADSHGAAPTFIGPHTVIEGRVVAAGDLAIAGRISGGVTCADADCPAHVHVLRGAVVDGDVHAGVVIVDGSVGGDVTGTETVRLGGGAEVGGDVSYARLDMAMDARVGGRLVQLERSEPSNVVPLKP